MRLSGRATMTHIDPNVTPFSDFGMTPPNVAGFVQAQNEPTLEVLPSLAKTPAS